MPGCKLWSWTILSLCTKLWSSKYNLSFLPPGRISLNVSCKHLNFLSFAYEANHKIANLPHCARDPSTLLWSSPRFCSDHCLPYSMSSRIQNYLRKHELSKMFKHFRLQCKIFFGSPRRTAQIVMVAVILERGSAKKYTLTQRLLTIYSFISSRIWLGINFVMSENNRVNSTTVKAV